MRVLININYLSASKRRYKYVYNMFSKHKFDKFTKFIKTAYKYKIMENTHTEAYSFKLYKRLHKTIIIRKFVCKFIHHIGYFNYVLKQRKSLFITSCSTRALSRLDRLKCPILVSICARKLEKRIDIYSTYLHIIYLIEGINGPDLLYYDDICPFYIQNIVTQVRTRKINRDRLKVYTYFVFLEGCKYSTVQSTYNTKVKLSMCDLLRSKYLLDDVYNSFEHINTLVIRYLAFDKPYDILNRLRVKLRRVVVKLQMEDITEKIEWDAIMECILGLNAEEFIIKSSEYRLNILSLIARDSNRDKYSIYVNIVSSISEVVSKFNKYSYRGHCVINIKKNVKHLHSKLNKLANMSYGSCVIMYYDNVIFTSHAFLHTEYV